MLNAVEQTAKPGMNLQMKEQSNHKYEQSNFEQSSFEKHTYSIVGVKRFRTTRNAEET